MPTYQYACTECGEQLEVVQKFTDDPLTVCSACGGKLRKLFSAVGIVFKGSGFYRTDSRNGTGNGGKKAESTTASGDSGSKPDSAAKPAETGSSGTGSSKKTEPAGSPSSSKPPSSSGTKVA